MLAFIVQRLLLAVLTVWVISVLSFAIIQLPPGDFVTAYIAQLSASGASVSESEAAALRELYGLGQPFYVQYAKWIARVLVGDFGVSMEWNRPVTEVIGDRLWLTMLISFAALVITWGLALPIGIYSAVRQYSIGDYLFTLVGFIGLAVPNFLLALVIMYLSFRFLGANVGGLFSAEYELADWSWSKAWDLIKHLPLPAVILALGGTAQLIRIMRANLLDELRRPYVVTARAKGLPEGRSDPEVPRARRTESIRQHRRVPFPLSGLRQRHHIDRPQPADRRAIAGPFIDLAGHVPRRHHRASCSACLQYAAR